MISHKFKFILILPSKTGSTSIVSALQEYIEIKKIIQQRGKGTFDFTEPSDHLNNKLRKHAKLSSYHEDYIREYKLYGVTRNPFDRVASWWRWTLRNKKIDQEKLPFIRFLHTHRFWSTPMTKSFSTKHPHKYDLKTIRFERLSKDFSEFCEDVNIPNIHLSQMNVSRHKHYTEYYDDETRQIVAEKHAKDIEYFGYKFEE